MSEDEEFESDVTDEELHRALGQNQNGWRCEHPIYYRGELVGYRVSPHLDLS